MNVCRIECTIQDCYHNCHRNCNHCFIDFSIMHIYCSLLFSIFSFSALMLLVGYQEGHPARKILTDEVLAWLSSGEKCK